MKLRTRVVLLFLLQTIAITMYIFFYWQPSYIQHIEKRELETKRNALELLATATLEPILKGELSQVYEILDAQKKHHPEWRFIELRNAKDVKIYPLPTEKTIHTHDDRIFHIVQNISFEGEDIAILKVDLDLKQLVREETEFLSYLLSLIVAGLIVCSLIMAFFLDRSIALPIRALSAASERLKQGSFSVPIPSDGRRQDELGALLTNFADMRDSLEHYQKGLKTNASRLKAVLDTVTDGIVMINNQGLIESVNHSMTSLFGYTEIELVGQPVTMLMEETQATKHNIYLDRHITSGGSLKLSKDRQLYAVRKSGEIFPVELNVSEVWHGKHKKFVGTIRDITDREKIDRLKNEFVSTVSHELRTPITSIKGSLDLMAAGVVGKVPHKALNLVNIAKSNSSRLLHLVNDILDIEKIESGTINFNTSEVSVHWLINNVINANTTYAKQFSVKLNVCLPEQDMLIDIDKDRIIQVLTNLVSNACKFSHPNSTVEIGASFENNNVTFFVKDHGQGIPDDFRSRIFSKFAQADGSDTRRAGGSGLGLSISKQLVEKMSGRIWYESETGTGSTFYCKFSAKEYTNHDSQQIAKL